MAIAPQPESDAVKMDGIGWPSPSSVAISVGKMRGETSQAHPYFL